MRNIASLRAVSGDLDQARQRIAAYESIITKAGLSLQLPSAEDHGHVPLETPLHPRSARRRPAVAAANAANVVTPDKRVAHSQHSPPVIPHVSPSLPPVLVPASAHVAPAPASASPPSESPLSLLQHALHMVQQLPARHTPPRIDSISMKSSVRSASLHPIASGAGAPAALPPMHPSGSVAAPASRSTPPPASGTSIARDLVSMPDSLVSSAASSAAASPRGASSANAAVPRLDLSAALVFAQAVANRTSNA